MLMPARRVVSLVAGATAAGLALCGLVLAVASPALAQSANVTRCYVHQSNGALIIVNGQTSAQQCQTLAVRCTGNPRVVSTFSLTPVVIRQAYTSCGEL